MKKLITSAVVVVVASCSPTNPFDPATPAANQAKGSLTGTVELVDGFSGDVRVDALNNVRVGLFDSEHKRVTDNGVNVAIPLIDVDGGDGEGSGRGDFVFDALLPGNYTVVVEGVPSFYTQAALGEVRVLPGSQLDVGAILFTVIGEGAGPGSITGTVSLDGGAGGQRKITLFQKLGDDVAVKKSLVTPGDFSILGLDPGAYALVAESDGYTPAFRLDVLIGEAGGQKLAQTFTGEDSIVLHPVSGAILPIVGPDVLLDDGIFFVRADSIALAILGGTAAVDVGVTSMRVGTTPDLSDVPAFEPYNAQKTLALPAREGNIGIFVQLQAESDSGFSFTSPVFSTSIVRDVSPPRVLDPTIVGLARAPADPNDPSAALGPFLSPTRSLVVRFDAQDDVSAVDGVGVAAGAAPPATTDDVTGPNGLARFERPLNVGADGATSVWILIEDKAGNRAEPVELPIIVDTTPPDVGLTVANADGAGVLATRTASVAFDESASTTDLPVAVQLRVVGGAFSEIEPYPLNAAGTGLSDALDVFIDPSLGNDGDVVTLEARLFDRVGNERTVSAQVTLHLVGTLVGTVVAEGVPLITPSPAGAVVDVVDGAGNVIGTDTVAADGSFAITGVPETSPGSLPYAVTVALDGYRTARRAGLVVPSPAPDGTVAVVNLEAVELTLARGNLVGSALLSDVIGGAGHAGTTVTLTLVGPPGPGARNFVDVTQTDDAGTYTFADLPVTRATESVRLEANHDGYAIAVGNATVAPDVVGDAGVLSLARNRGEFDVCRPAPDACVPQLFVNTSVVRVRLRDPSNVVSLVVSVNGGPNQNVPLAADNATDISLAGVADGLAVIALQTQNADGSTSAPLTSSVTLDTLPPTQAVLERVPSPTARDPRFTNQQFVEVKLKAEPGVGAVAPLALPRLVVGDAAAPPPPPPAAQPDEIVGCTQGDTACRLALPGADVDAVLEKRHEIFGVSCDLAGNCADAVSTFVIYDDTPPSRGNGADFLVLASGSVIDNSGATPVVVMPSAFYAGELHLGAAHAADGSSVVDETDVAVADVFAFRFSLAQATLSRAALQSFTDPPVADAVRSGGDVGVPALAPITGVQTIFAELVDAAGNAAGGFQVSVRIDSAPPGLIFAVNGGLSTNNPSVGFTVSAPAGAEVPVRVELLVDGGAGAGNPGVVSFALPLTGAERISLPAVDGTHRVLATAFDAVGNHTSSEAAIVLDRQGPRVDAARCIAATCVDDGLGTIVSSDAAAKIDLSVVASDVNALSAVTQAKVRVGNGAAVTFPINAVTGVQLPANTATSISVSAVDAVGNEGAAVVRSVLHDSIAPNVTTLTLAAGAARTKDVNVPVHVVADADAVEMRFSTSSTFAGAFLPLRSDDFFTLSGADGSKQICVQVKDAAGNLGSRCASIFLDRAAPTGTVTLALAGGAGVTATSSLNVPVSLAYPADTVSVAVSATALACDSIASTPYVAATGSPQAATATLTPGDGVRTIFACFLDGAGNAAAASTVVTLDQQRPTVAAALDGGAAFSLDTSVGLTLAASADVDRMAIVVDGAIDCSTATMIPFNPSTTQTLPAADGAHTVSVCVQDATGNRSATPAVASIIEDTTDPSGSIVVNGGAAFTRSLDVTAVLTRSSDVVLMAVAPVANLNCVAADFVSFNPGNVVHLPGPDGTATVSVCLKDAAGRTSRFTDTIVLDRVAPNGTVIAAGGAATTPVRDVSVALTFDADTTGIAVSAFPLSCDTAIFTAPTANTTVTLPFVGNNTVTACLQDGAGNVRAISDDIFLEDTAGDSLVIAVAGGAATTRTRSVIVSLFRPSTDFTDMKVVEAPTLDCSDLSGYEAFNSSKALVLSAGTAPFEGNRTVSACVRSPSTNITKSANDSIFVDSFAPDGAIVLNAGDAVTGQATVTATLANNFAAQGETVTVALSETSTLVNGDCSGSFEAFSAAKSFTISGVDGTRAVFLCLRDGAGNTRELSDSIVLDRAAPAPVSVSVPSSVTSTSVTATLTFPADAVEAAVAAGAIDCATSTAYLPASGTRGVVLAAVEGAQNVLACFRDAAGNASQATTTTTLDLSDPTGVVTVNGGAAFTTSRLATANNVTLQVSADVARIAVIEQTAAPDCTSPAVTYQAFAAQVPFAIGSSGDGTKTVNVCLEDRAGRRAAAVPDTIVLDTTAPNGTVLVADGAAATKDRNVILTLSNGGAVDVVSYAVAEGSITCNAANLAYLPFAGAVPFVLSSGDGTKTVLTCLKDAAGNVSTTSGSDSIVLDTAAPALPAVNAVDIQDGDGFLQAEATINVVLNWSVAGDAKFGKLAEGAVDCQSPTGYVALGAGVTTQTFAAQPVSAGEGTKLFVACFKDDAGNVSTAQDSTLRDNTAPTVSSIVCTDCTSDGTTTFTTDNTVVLAVTSDEAGAGVASALVSIDGGADVGTAVTSGVVTVGGLTAGNRAIRVKLVDKAGNASSVAQSKTIAVTFDNAPPTLTSLTLNGGAAATNSRVVNVAIAGASADTVAMAVAEADGSGSAIASCATATYAPFVSAFTRTLPANDGTKAESVCLKDAAGNKSVAPVTTTIVLDSLPPSLPANAVDIQDGDGFLNGEAAINVVLRWNVAGDAVRAKIGEGSVDCSGASGYVALPGAATTTTLNAVPISAGDGVKSLTTCFQDAAGNTTTAQDSSVRDNTAPVVTNLACTNCTSDGTTTFSTSSSISLAVTSDEAGTGVASALVSIDNVNGGADAAATVTNGVVTVSGLTAGARAVRVKLVDRAGNASSVAQSKTVNLTVDLTPPALAVASDFRLNGANTGKAVNDPAVVVTINNPPADAVQMSIVEAASLTCSTATYVPLATASTFVVSSAPEGLKTLQLCLKDRAGNTSTTAVAGSITLDTLPPSLPASGSVIIQDGGDELLTSVSGGVSVRLNWNTAGDVVAIKLGESSVDCSSGTYETPAIGGVNTFLRTALPLSATDGTKLVVVCFKDAAGNIATGQDTTVLDQGAPTGSVSVAGGAAFAVDPTENVQVTVRASADTARVALVETSATNGACTTPTVNCAAATYAAIGGSVVGAEVVSTSTQNFAGAPATEGAKCFEACFEDTAGNRSATAALDGITFDKTAPTLVVDARRAGSAAPGDAGAVRFTNTRDTIVTFSTLADTNGIASVALKTGTPDATCSGANFIAVPQAAPFTLSFTLDDADGLQTVGACAKDNAGNLVTTTKQITLDRQPPQASLAVAAGAQFSNVTTANGVTVTMTLTPSNDSVRRVDSLNPLFNCNTAAFSGSFAAQPASYTTTLAVPDGTKTAVSCFQDASGNISTATDDIILDTTPPTAVFVADLGNTFTLDTSVTADFTSVADNFSSTAQLQFKASSAALLDCSLAGGYAAFVSGTTIAPALAAPDGPKTVRACLKDAAGNFAAFTDSIALDVTNPTVAFTVEKQGGAAPDPTFTNTLAVTVRATGIAADAVAIGFGETTLDCSTASYEALPSPLPTPFLHDFALAAGSDGVRTVAVCVKDASGRTSGALGTTSTINLDTAPPVVTLLIDSDGNLATVNDSITPTDAVTITLASSPAADPLRQASVPLFHKTASLDCTGLTFSGAFATLPATRSATLDNDAGFNDSGTKFISACFQDRAGNVAAVVDDIFFDEDRPNFAGRPFCTGCNLVDATPAAADTRGDDFLGFHNQSQLVSFDPAAASADVQAVLALQTDDIVSTEPDAFLQSTGIGEDRFCTVDSNCNQVIGEICEDFPVVDNGTAPPTIAKRCVIESAPESVLAPVPATDKKYLTVLALRDVAGNFSNAREVFVVRDRVAATVSYALNVSGATSSQTIFVRNLALTGETAFPTAVKMGTYVASNLATFADVTPLDYTDITSPFQLVDAIPVSLSAGDGTKTVHVVFTDNAGNVSGDVTQNVTLDTTAPSRPIFATASSVVGPAAAPLTVSLAQQSDDAAGSGLRAVPYELVLPPGVGCQNLDGPSTELTNVSGVCQWTGNPFTLNVNALGADGEKRFFVRAFDNAGNQSDTDVLTIEMDATAPTRPCYLSGCVAPQTEFTSDTTASLDVLFQATDLHFASYQACVTTGGTCDCTPQDVPGATFTVSLVSNATNRVCVAARDVANNVSATDTALVIQDSVAPTAPQFTRPLTEVTGAQTFLLFDPATTSQTDPNFSHFEVTGGGHIDTKRLCPVVSSPFCVSPQPDERLRMMLDTNGKALALLVDLEAETDNQFFIQAVDKAGNKSGTAKVDLFEGSVIVASTTLERSDEKRAMVSSGDRIAYIVGDNNTDELDQARVIGPGLDLHYGSADDESFVISDFVQVAAKTSAAVVDDFALQSYPFTLGGAGVAWIDGQGNGALQSGALKLRTFGNNTLFDGDDATITLTPFTNANDTGLVACGATQRGFRNPAMGSQGKIVVSCFFSDTDYDVVLMTPGANNKYEAAHANPRDDQFIVLANTTNREQLPALHHETAAWLAENGDGTHNVVVRRPGPNGVLGDGDDVTRTVASNLAAGRSIPPALYFPDDPSVPSCQSGVLYADATSFIHQNPGPNGILGDGDDIKTIITGTTANNVTVVLGKLEIGPGSIVFQAGFTDSETVVSPGPNRCYENEFAGGSDDVRIDDLHTQGTNDLAAGSNAWFELATPGVFSNQIIIHDLFTRRPLVDGNEQFVSDVSMGSGFALFGANFGDVKVIDFDPDDLVVRTRSDSSIFNRSFVAAGNKFETNDENNDTITVIEPGADGDLLTGDDRSVFIASDASQGPVVDDIDGTQRNTGLSPNMIAWLSGVDSTAAAIKIQFAGANGVFQAIGGAGDDTACTPAIAAGPPALTSLIPRGWLSVDNTKIAYVDRNFGTAGDLRVFEPTVATNPCGGGTVSTLTNVQPPIGQGTAIARVIDPILSGQRVAAFETSGETATNVVIFDAPSGNFSGGVFPRRSCKIPTGWIRGFGKDITFFEGQVMFFISRNNLNKTVSCDLGSDTIRVIDPNQPGPREVSANGRTMLQQSISDNSMYQTQLDR